MSSGSKQSAQRRIYSLLAPQQTPSHITNVILERSTKCAAKDLRFARLSANAIPHHKCHPGAEHEVRSEGSAVRSPLSKRHPTSQTSSWSGAKCGAKDLQFARLPANAIPHHKCHPGAEHEVRSEGSAVCSPSKRHPTSQTSSGSEAKCGAKRSAERSEVRSEAKCGAKDLRFARPQQRHPTSQTSSGSKQSAQRRICSSLAQQTPSDITNVILERSTKCAAKDLRLTLPSECVSHKRTGFGLSSGCG
jgi:hypothetical protein